MKAPLASLSWLTPARLGCLAALLVPLSYLTTYGYNPQPIHKIILVCMLGYSVFAFLLWYHVRKHLNTLSFFVSSVSAGAVGALGLSLVKSTDVSMDVLFGIPVAGAVLACVVGFPYFLFMGRLSASVSTPSHDAANRLLWIVTIWGFLGGFWWSPMPRVASKALFDMSPTAGIPYVPLLLLLSVVCGIWLIIADVKLLRFLRPLYAGKLASYRVLPRRDDQPGALLPLVHNADTRGVLMHVSKSTDGPYRAEESLTPIGLCPLTTIPRRIYLRPIFALVLIALSVMLFQRAMHTNRIIEEQNTPRPIQDTEPTPNGFELRASRAPG